MGANRALSRLGLAMRAGKLVTGDEAVMKAVRSGEAKLVVLARDASENTGKNLRTNAGHTAFRWWSDSIVKRLVRQSANRSVSYSP